MIDVLEELRAASENRIGDWSDDDRETLVEVGKDLAKFQAKLVAGQDVDETELALAKAAGKNLAAAATVTGAMILMDFLERIAWKAIAALRIYPPG